MDVLLLQLHKDDNMLLVQILGGVFGLFTAWLIDFGFNTYHKIQLQKLKIQHQIELENYKKTLKKSR